MRPDKFDTQLRFRQIHGVAVLEQKYIHSFETLIVVILSRGLIGNVFYQLKKILKFWERTWITQKLPMIS